MEEKIKKNFNKILAIFILIQPILDLITGVFIHVFNINLTLGIIIRMLFLIFVMITATFIYKNTKNLIYYFAFLIYTCLYILGIIIFKDSIGLFSEIQGLLRVFYFPLMLLSLYSIKEELRISKMVLMTSLITYLILIFIPNALNIGFKSYEITKSGTLGFFNSANEISGIISILTPVMITIFYESKKYVISTLIGILYLVVILTIGTKTPLLSLIITISLAILWLWIKSLKQKKYKIIGISLVTILILSLAVIAVLPKTNFYKNIKVHMDYLKVDDLGDILEKPKLIDHFIFSQRLTFLDKKQKLYKESTIYQKLFGIGYLKNGKQTKAIEMDYFDIYYSHGIIGCLLFFITYIYILFKILKNRKKIVFSEYMSYVSLLLIVFLSLFTGHIITAPAVSILVITIILMLEKKKKSLLFTSYDLNVGGIEKALINLVNKIDLKKYDVNLILESKEGSFLKDLNKNINVTEYRVNNNKNIMIRKLLNYMRRILFTIFNYHRYDFSCCYATYSLSGNKLSKIASKNSSIYIHSNYKYVYKTEEELREFFAIRKLEEFKHILFVSNEAKKDYLNYYPKLKEKTKVFNNFVNMEEIKTQAKKKIREIKPKDKKLFVFVGRLDDTSKKVGRAINLIKETIDTELWIVGDGPDREKYQAIINENKLNKRIKMIGEQQNPYPYMNKADYIILTSDYEGFPVIYLEAITLQKQIITTIPVSDEALSIGNNYGEIIPKDEKQMIKEVKRILKEKQQLNKMDLKEIQNTRMKKLEMIFDEVM